MLTKIFRKIKKACETGPVGTYTILYHRLHKKVFIVQNRKKALQKRAMHTWQDICKKEHISDSFTQFFHNTYVHYTRVPHTSRCDSPWFTYAYTQDQNKEEHNTLHRTNIIAQANKYLAHKFSLFDSQEIVLKEINWHSDVIAQNRYKQIEPYNTKTCQTHGSKYNFDKNRFYSDISISCGTSNARAKDIKVPWELARFQHLPILAEAYTYTKDEAYAHYFATQIIDWIEQNPYLLGIHWLCPMEVAIRAINWIHAFCSFAKSNHIDITIWQQFVCSLYDHFIYLEHNWELADLKTSNHYLSDLLGYFYLCLFFQECAGTKKKLRWCYQEMLRELDKQIADDGSSYEGSTAYHRLVTEIGTLFCTLCTSDTCTALCEQPIPASIVQKLHRMHDFLNWCTPHNGKLILIGDNDSGHIVHPLLHPQKVNMTHKTLFANYQDQTPVCAKYTQPKKVYKNFGLSVLKTDTHHLTLRHHVYKHTQPSGHFHNDFAAITYAYNGTPIIIDSGSYVYTPSRYWRNKFRSVHAHSTFFLPDIEPVSFGQELFELAIPEQQYEQKQTDPFTLETTHNLYKHVGLEAKRVVQLDTNKNSIIIEDSWRTSKKDCTTQTSATLNSNPPARISCWNFIIAPGIGLEKAGSNIILTTKECVITVQSNDLEFKIENTWVSEQYGTKIKTKKLTAQAPIIQNNPPWLKSHGIKETIFTPSTSSGQSKYSFPTSKAQPVPSPEPVGGSREGILERINKSYVTQFHIQT